MNFTELQAERNIPIKKKEWVEILDSFLKLNRYELLNNAGSISHNQAMIKAETEHQKFRNIQNQKFISDFDKEIKNIKK